MLLGMVRTSSAHNWHRLCSGQAAESRADGARAVAGGGGGVWAVAGGGDGDSSAPQGCPSAPANNLLHRLGPLELVVGKALPQVGALVFGSQDAHLLKDCCGKRLEDIIESRPGSPAVATGRFCHGAGKGPVRLLC